MKVIGLVGGIGSGKSTVARLMGQYGGVTVIDADQLGHEVLRQNEVKTLVKSQWGDALFGDDGEIDRRKMAAMVFSGTREGNANLELLNKISHPRIAELLTTHLETARMANVRMILLDAPLLLEGKWDRFCNDILFVDAPEQVRIARVLARGWTMVEYQARVASQLPLDAKRNAARFVINNDCSLDELKQRVNHLWECLCGDL